MSCPHSCEEPRDFNSLRLLSMSTAACPIAPRRSAVEPKQLKTLRRAQNPTLCRRVAAWSRSHEGRLDPATAHRGRMDALSSFEQILRDLLIFIVAMSVVLAALLVIISRMPNDNPLKRILVALSYRVGPRRRRGCSSYPRPHPRPRRHRRFRRADRPPLVLVDLLPQRAPPSARETSPMKFMKANGLVIHLSRPGPARRAGACLHQFARDRLPDLERGCREFSRPIFVSSLTTSAATGCPSRGLTRTTSPTTRATS